MCSDTVEIKLKEPSLLTLNLKCESNNLLLLRLVGVKPYIYYWRDLSNAIFSNDSLLSFNPDQFYDFEVIDSKGCQLSDSVSLFVDFSVDKTIGDVPLTIQLTNFSSEGLHINGILTMEKYL